MNRQCSALAAPIFMLLLISATGLSAVSRFKQKESEAQKIARERKETEQNLRLLQKQAKEYEAGLQRASAEEKQSVSALQNIERQVRLYKEIVGELTASLAQLGKQITALQAELKKAERDLAVMKENFARYAVGIYKFGVRKNMEVLFSASSVNQAIVRAEYIKQFEAAGKRKIDDITKKQEEIAVRKADLSQRYDEEKTLWTEKREQLITYQARQKERERMVTELRKNQQKYKEQLTQSRESAAQLQDKIADLVRAEDKAIRAELDRKALIAAERKRKLAEQKAVPKTDDDKPSAEKKNERRSDVALEKSEPLTAIKAPDDFDYNSVSANFDENKGRLPWPVRGGVIVQTFGRNENKELKIATFNNGVDISVPLGSDVCAVSGGKVSRIAFLPTFGNIVIVRHLNGWMTVYANLGEVRVAKDEAVRSGEVIGASGKGTTAGSIVHFEIWKGGEKVDPELWLLRRESGDETVVAR